jgi:hypothetical protein
MHFATSISMPEWFNSGKYLFLVLTRRQNEQQSWSLRGTEESSLPPPGKEIRFSGFPAHSHVPRSEANLVFTLRLLYLLISSFLFCLFFPMLPKYRETSTHLREAYYYSELTERGNGSCRVQRKERFSATTVPFPASESAVVRWFAHVSFCTCIHL